MGQHLSATPVSPSKLRPELPPGLDVLVLDLLAKRPEERPASAAEARRALESLDLSPAAPAEVAEAEENPLDRLAGGIFVGRERELSELRGVVDDARGGAGGLVLLVGEPGIGKTRTAEELATYARVQGARVHWGHCHEGEGAPAYWPWAEAIRSYVRDADPVGLAWELGAGAAEIARIVPELREQVGSTAEPGDGDEHDEARFRLFDAVATFLSGAARSRPLMLVLDDLHWADEPSLLLLRFLARSFGDSPLLIAGTYRDVELGRHHPLASTLSELAGAERTTRVQLRGLDSAAVERYIEMSTGTTPAPGLADAVLEQTEGNPFFVSEVVRLLASEGRLEAGAAGTAGSWLPQIPQGVREVVGRRLDRLSDQANSVLTVAAAIGREFSLDVLARACETCDEEQVTAALEEAARARIVTDAGGPRRYSFSHALVRETLYAEIPATRRAAVHGRIAAAIEEVHGDDRAMLSSLAHQFLEAAPAGDPARAAEYARRAAEQATNRLAHEDAVVLLERARDVLDLDRQSGRALRMEIELELGEAQTRASRYADARETLEDAAAIAREIGDGEALARAACDVSALSEAGSFDRGIAELVEEALEGAGAEEGSLRSKLLSALAAEYYWEDPVGKAEPLSVEALELARRIGDDEAIASALVRRQFVAGNDAEGTRQPPRRGGRALRDRPPAGRPRDGGAGLRVPRPGLPRTGRHRRGRPRARRLRGARGAAAPAPAPLARPAPARDAGDDRRSLRRRRAARRRGPGRRRARRGTACTAVLRDPDGAPDAAPGPRGGDPRRRRRDGGALPGRAGVALRARLDRVPARQPRSGPRGVRADRAAWLQDPAVRRAARDRARARLRRGRRPRGRGPRRRALRAARSLRRDQPRRRPRRRQLRTGRRRARPAGADHGARRRGRGALRDRDRALRADGRAALQGLLPLRARRAPARARRRGGPGASARVARPRDRHRAGDRDAAPRRARARPAARGPGARGRRRHHVDRLDDRGGRRRAPRPLRARRRGRHGDDPLLRHRGLDAHDRAARRRALAGGPARSQQPLSPPPA